MSGTFMEMMGTSRDLRHKIAAAWLGVSLARQIRAIRKTRGWSQGELARRSELSIGTVVRYEKSCANAQLNNLARIAAAFDCALICGFVSFGEFVRIMITEDGLVLVPQTFEDEDKQMQSARAPEAPSMRICDHERQVGQ